MNFLGNERVIVDLEAENVEGFPDGMAIDTEGKLWVACFFGGKINRFDPETGMTKQRRFFIYDRLCRIGVYFNGNSQGFYTFFKSDRINDNL